MDRDCIASSGSGLCLMQSSDPRSLILFVFHDRIHVPDVRTIQGHERANHLYPKGTFMSLSLVARPDSRKRFWTKLEKPGQKISFGQNGNSPIGSE